MVSEPLSTGYFGQTTLCVQEILTAATTKTSNTNKLQKFVCDVKSCQTHTKFSFPNVVNVDGKCYCWSHEKDIDNQFYLTIRQKSVERCKSLQAKLTLPKNKDELTAFSKAFGITFVSSWFVWLDITNLNKIGIALHEIFGA